MTNYLIKKKRSLVKVFLLYLLSYKFINNLFILILNFLPNNQYKDRVPVITGPVVFKFKNIDLIKMYGADNCYIAKQLYWNKGMLRDQQDNLSIKLAIDLSSQAEHFFDIGAYTGFFSLCVAAKNRNIKVVAFEIVPSNLIQFLNNIFINDLVTSIEPRLLGLSDKEGHINIPITFGRGVLETSVALDSDSIEGIKIPITKLDNFLNSSSGKGVWKIDVETFELSVLNGAKQIIKKTSPDIICEVLSYSTEKNQLTNFLKERNYFIYRITKNGLLKVSSVNNITVDDEKDYLFTIRSESELINLFKLNIIT